MTRFGPWVQPDDVVLPFAPQQQASMIAVSDFSGTSPDTNRPSDGDVFASECNWSHGRVLHSIDFLWWSDGFIPSNNFPSTVCPALPGDHEAVDTTPVLKRCGARYQGGGDPLFDITWTHWYAHWQVQIPATAYAELPEPELPDGAVGYELEVPASEPLSVALGPSENKNVTGGQTVAYYLLPFRTAASGFGPYYDADVGWRWWASDPSTVDGDLLGTLTAGSNSGMVDLGPLDPDQLTDPYACAVVAMTEAQRDDVFDPADIGRDRTIDRYASVNLDAEITVRPPRYRFVYGARTPLRGRQRSSGSTGSIPLRGRAHTPYGLRGRQDSNR